MSLVCPESLVWPVYRSFRDHFFNGKIFRPYVSLFKSNTYPHEWSGLEDFELFEDKIILNRWDQEWDGSRWHVTHPRVTFTFDKSITAYGYVVYRWDSYSWLMWSERFRAGPVNIPKKGGTIDVGSDIFFDGPQLAGDLSQYFKKEHDWMKEGF